MGSPVAASAPVGACRSTAAGCTATLLRPDGEGSGTPIVRTRAGCAALRRPRRGVAAAGRTGRPRGRQAGGRPASSRRLIASTLAT